MNPRWATPRARPSCAAGRSSRTIAFRFGTDEGECRLALLISIQSANSACRLRL